MVPKRLQPVLWSHRTSKLDPKRHQEYIIHQVLAHGRWSDLKWLVKTYGLERIKEVFLKRPAKMYRPQKLNFAARLFLGLRNFDWNKYDQTVPRRAG